MLLSAELIEINREPHMLVSGLDITQRKQAEAELLRTLAEDNVTFRYKDYRHDAQQKTMTWKPKSSSAAS